MRTRWKTAAAAALLAAVALATLAATTPIRYRRSTCVICRQVRVESDSRLAPARFLDEECTTWYAANVEPEHPHLWEPSPVIHRVSYLGRPYPAKIPPPLDLPPIWTLDPEVQLEIYQHVDDPLEAKAIFSRLTRDDAGADRIDDQDCSTGHLMAWALTRWASSQFPGDWNEFWGRIHGAHAGRRRQYLAWQAADPGLNFFDWSDRQDAAAAIADEPADDPDRPATALKTEDPAAPFELP